MKRIGLLSILSVGFMLSSHAASPEKYAASSVLSQGNWARIEISTPGLQTITSQTLKNFGFSNPNDVYVYGYGGRMTSEALNANQPDDLTPAQVIRRNDGSISFYATGCMSIQASRSSAMNFDHSINPYTESSYYFISDRAPASVSDSDTNTNFIDMSDIDGLGIQTSSPFQIVHERDLMQCAESGRDYLGEDFRSAKSQDFKFDLTDNLNGNARIRIKFATNTTAQSSILVSANGQRLSATNSDKIGAVSSSEQYFRAATTVKTASDVGNSLTVGIEYSQAGVVNIARLDWIEVEYERSLIMRDSQLYFHVNNARPAAYQISGATEQTVVWDVTNPADIKEVKGLYNPSDNTITLGVQSSGIREFFAFEPSAKGAIISGRTKVANQNIHSMPIPDMVIITPDLFTSAAEKIAGLHRQIDGMTVHVLSPEKIYNEFSGGHPDVSAFRKLLKMWYDRGLENPDGKQLGYCLLMGRPTFDQKQKNPASLKAGYPFTLIWQSSGAFSETSSYCTDDFIGMLEDENIVRDMSQRKINVAVGRYPVTSANEANIVVDKLESYLTNPDYGIWRNNILIIADDGDNAQHLDQAQKAINHLQLNDAGAHYAYERLYLDAFEQKNTGTGVEFPDAKKKMLDKWQKEGTSVIKYIGHANPKEWSHEKLLTWNDINTMSNIHLPILYAATCSFGKWDAESVSGAEVMLSNPAGGAIAIITPSRTVYITKNESITNSVADEMFRRDETGHGQRIGDILKNGKNNCSLRDDNTNRYHLFGNPALRIPLPQLTVEVDSIANLPIAENQADAPTIQARSSVRISGKVTDAEGNIVDFNGPVQYVLYDAEKSVTTHGWGEDGKESTYSDRNVKLATGSTLAVNGVWSANILMPSEIENNYTPALITLYAYDSKLNLEANGSTDRLYVYGYDLNSAEDHDGPSIEAFVLNSYSFAEGDVVHSNPIAIASFSDESGINISDAGIGHKMSLILDNDKLFDDLDNYFTPDTEYAGKGSISYPISGLEPGEHELKLTVWDNANNSSSETIKFKVGLNMKPEVADLSIAYDHDSDMLSLLASTDRAQSKLHCRFECLSLNGDLLWSTDRTIFSGKQSTVSYSWDLKDHAGKRINRGIYILRAYITTEDGLSTSKSKKIAIPAK